MTLYDDIGIGYSHVRRPDPRIEQQIHAPLRDVAPVLNVGAGAGSYEPSDRTVVAVEPSPAMLRQRPAGSAVAIRGVADALPFAGDAFAGAMALLTIHHWPDPLAGLRELRRVTRGPVVVFTFDHEVHAEQWLVTDYLPAMLALDTNVPSPAAVADALGGGVVQTITVPHDCTDGFCHSWWRRPAAYLDPAVRAGISGIARLPAAVVDEAMARLEADLESGAWHRAHAALLEVDEIDAGYRLVVSDPRSEERSTGT